MAGKQMGRVLRVDKSKGYVRLEKIPDEPWKQEREEVQSTVVSDKELLGQLVEGSLVTWEEGEDPDSPEVQKLRLIS